MPYTVEHQKIESTVAGPFTVVVFRHRGQKEDRATAVVEATVTRIPTPEKCDEVAREYASNFGARIATPMLVQTGIVAVPTVLPQLLVNGLALAC